MTEKTITVKPEELKQMVKEGVREELKNQRAKKLKKKLVILLAGLSCLGGGIVGAKQYFKTEFDKTKSEVRVSTKEMRQEAHAELDHITGTNKVLGAFGHMGGRFAQWLRIQQAKDKK